MLRCPRLFMHFGENVLYLEVLDHGRIVLGFKGWSLEVAFHSLTPKPHLLHLINWIGLLQFQMTLGV